MNHCNDFAPCGPSIGQYNSYSYTSKLGQKSYASQGEHPLTIKFFFYLNNHHLYSNNNYNKKICSINFFNKQHITIIIIEN